MYIYETLNKLMRHEHLNLYCNPTETLLEPYGTTFVRMFSCRDLFFCSVFVFTMM